MTGLNDKTKKRVMLEGFTSDMVLAQELNNFYSRFDIHDFSNEIAVLKRSLLSSSDFTPSPSFSVQDVLNTFKHCKTKTSPGPDNIGSRLLIHCTGQLGSIFYHIFNVTLSTESSDLVETIHNYSHSQKQSP